MTWLSRDYGAHVEMSGRSHEVAVPEPVAKSFSPLRIFVSYAHDENDALTERLASDLKARGHDVWYDRERLLPGTDWEIGIEQGLEWAIAEPGRGRVVLLMTPHGLRRPGGFCLNEIARAQARGLTIVPVMVAWVEPPLSIARAQWLDMRDCLPIASNAERYMSRLELLLKALEGDEVDFDGARTRLEHVLEPFSFEADLSEHLVRFTGRQWVVDRIDAWLRSPDALRVLWITGEPGSGKTALASWLCSRHPAIKAFHLCRYNTERSNPKRCVLSVAYQLANLLPSYKSRLATLNLERVVREGNAETLFDLLLLQPLIETRPSHRGDIVILIDALDEATRAKSNELASMLAAAFRRAPTWLRLVITSRSEPPLPEILENFERFHLSASSLENVADIQTFLDRELAPSAGGVRASVRAIDTIVARSEGLFLYAEWVRREIGAGRLSVARPEEFPQGLGGMFLEYFERQFPEVASFQANVRPALGLAFAAQNPLPLRLLADILAWDSEYRVREFVESLGTLFRVVEGAVRPFHKELLDWLLNPSKAGRYYVSVREGHRILAHLGWNAYLRSRERRAGRGTREPLPPSAIEARCLEELAYHLANTGEEADRKRLAEYLSDVDVFVQLYWKNMYDLLGCWDALDDKPHFLQTFAEKLAGLERECTNAGRAALTSRTFGLFLYYEERYAEAEPFLEKAVRFHSETGDELVLAAALNDLGECYARNHKYDDAERSYQRALEIRRRLLSDFHPDTADSINNYGHVFYYREQHDTAEQHYEEALTIRQVLFPPSHPSIAESYNNLGVVASAKGDRRKAFDLYRRAVETMEKCGLQETWEAAMYDTHLAGAALAEGDHVAAEAGYARALHVRRKIFGWGNPSSLQSLFRLAGVYALQGRQAQVEDLLSRVPTQVVPVVLKPWDYAQELLRIANHFLAGQHQPEAEAFLDWVPRHFRSVYPCNTEATLALLTTTASFDDTRGRYEQAAARYSEALAVVERLHGLGHPDTLKVLCGLGRSLRLSGALDKAIGRYLQVINIGEGVLRGLGDMESPSCAEICSWTAVGYNEVAFHKHAPERNWRAAVEFYRRAVELVRKTENEIERGNMELNLQTALHYSGERADREEVKRLTSLLEAYGDPRAWKGKAILNDQR